MEKILITGANGLLATCLRKKLSQLDIAVTCVARQSLNTRFGGNETQIIADIAKPLDISDAFDVVIHCASQQPRQTATYDGYHRGNVLTLEHVLASNAVSKKTNVIYFSSAVVYGHLKGQKINEDTPISPQNDYALTKVFSEQLLALRTQQKQCTSICFRLPSLYGKEQAGGIVDTYYQALANSEPLDIFSEGKLIRNIMPFSEVVDATLHTIKKPVDTGYHLFLLGSQNSLPMFDIAHFIKTSLDVDTPIIRSTTQAPVAVDWDFDLSKTSKALGFTPATIETGLTQYLEDKVGSHDISNGASVLSS